MIKRVFNIPFKYEYIYNLTYIAILIFFFFYYLEAATSYKYPLNDELGYLDEGIHLRNVSYDFREIYNRNRTPFLPLVISFLSLTAKNLNPFLYEQIY